MEGGKGGRSPRGAVPSEHPNFSLVAQHPLVIGGQDQRLLPRHIVRLSAVVALRIKEQDAQELACGNRFAEAVGYEQMHGHQADGAERVEVSPSPMARQRITPGCLRLRPAPGAPRTAGNPGQ